MKHYGFGSRLLAWLCVVIMLVMMLPLSAAADDETAGDETAGDETKRYSIDVQHADTSSQGNVWAEVNGQSATEAAEHDTVTIVAEEDYKLTEITVNSTTQDIDVTVQDNSFKMPACNVIVVVRAEKRETVDVAFDLTNASATGATKVYADVDYTATLSAEAHYTLPENIKVYVGKGESLLESDEYTWNNTTGELKIEAKYLTGNVKVKAEAEEKPYVQFDGSGLTNLSLSPGAGKVYPSELVEDSYSVLLNPYDGYAVPTAKEDVAVVCDGSPVEFTYENGTVTIEKNVLKGLGENKTIEIGAAGVPIEYEITIDISKVNVESIYKNGDESKNILNDKSTTKEGKKVTFKATIEDTVVVNLKADRFCSVPDSVLMTGGTAGTEYSPDCDLNWIQYYNIATLTFEKGSIDRNIDVSWSGNSAQNVNLIFKTYRLGLPEPQDINEGYKTTCSVSEDYSINFNAWSGYTLPATITVKSGDTPLEDVTGNSEATAGYTWTGGTLTILQASLQAAVDNGNEITVEATAALKNDNLNSGDFKQDTVDKAGNVTAVNWNDAAILIKPTNPATKIVKIEIGEKKYNGTDDIYDGIIVGTNKEEIIKEKGKNYLEINDCKNEKITYRLSDGRVESAEGALYVSVDTTKPALSVDFGEDDKDYVNSSKTVVLTVDEKNFAPKKDDNWGVGIYPVVDGVPAERALEESSSSDNGYISWSKDNNTHKCSVTMTCAESAEAETGTGKFADGEYIIILGVYDDAGHYSNKKSGTIVLDAKKPDVSVDTYSVDEYKDEKYYTNDTVSVTFEAADANFAANMLGEYEVTVTGVEGENSQTITDGVAWRGDVCTVTLNCADETQEMVNELADGEYTVALTVTDAAGNSNTARSDTIVLDKTAPDVEVTSYKVNGVDFASYKETGNRYVNDSIAITFKVTEKNFDKDLFRFEGLPDTDGSYSKSEWSDDGDVHTITLTLTADGTNDGIYNAIKLVGKDMADNDGGETTEPIVLDKTVPEIKSVTYEEKGGFKLLEQIWWWIAGKLNPDTEADGYSRTVKATVGISDDLSPVDALEVLPSSEVKNLEVKTEEGTSATYTFEASSQFMEELKITATDAAGNTCGAFEVQKDENGDVTGSPNLLIDTYAPTIDFGTIDYSSVHSSNYPVTVTVTDPKVENVYSGLKQVTVSVHYQQSGTKADSISVSDLSGYDYSDGVYTKDFASSDYTQEKSFTVTLPVNLHSNLVYVEVTAEDNAGNTVTATSKDNGQYIKLDSVAPIVSVVYDNNSAQNSKYFMQSRTATITVTDNNFSADGMTINTQGTVGGWTATGATNDDGQQNVYTCTVSYASDADYTLNVTAADLGGNTTNDAAVDYSGQTAAQDFTVDLTDPTFTIGMVSGDAEIRSSGYSNQAVTVTLTVNEHNFDSSAATAGLTVIHEGVDISQSIRSSLSWSSNGDVRTASFVLTDDGEYAINLSFQDLAGNSTAVASDVIVYVDQTNPLVYVTGVADKSANAQREIVPVVTIWDKYYDGNSVEIRLRNGAGQDVTSKYLDMENDRSEVMYDEQRDMYYQTFTFKNITEDHVYHLEVRHTDLAGNTNTTMTVLNAKGEETVLDIEKEVMRFSVNRNGSTYSADDDTLEILGKYIQSAKNVRILEINVDELDPDSIYITLTHDNITRDLVNGDDYTYQVPPEQNEASWNVYEYVFADSLFADDGIYTISIYSVDAAGNVAQNNTEEKDFEITFVVDKTPPIFVAVNLEAGEIYNEEQHEVTINCSDNIAFDSVQVYRLDSTAEKDENGNYIWFRETSDGEMEMLCEPVELAAVEGSNGDYTFVIYEGDSAATSKQSVLVVCTDKAGNQNVEQEILDFTVSSSFWIRFYANKPLFYGSIGGISALLILAAILFLTKRREEK